MDTLIGTREEVLNESTGEIEAIIRPPVSQYEAVAEQQRGHILSLEEIEAADDILEAVVYIPEWGGSVKVRQFSKDVEFRLRKQATIGGKVDNTRLEMLIVINGMVEPAVTEEHLALLQGKSMKAVDTILAKITALNAISTEAAEEATRQFRDGR